MCALQCWFIRKWNSRLISQGTQLHPSVQASISEQDSGEKQMGASGLTGNSLERRGFCVQPGYLKLLCSVLED